jgi:hypothetical protein
VLLIDDRPPPPPPRQRPVWDPDWRTVAWVVACLAAAIGSALTIGLVAYLLLCTAVGCGGQAISRLLPSTFGLREYRQ